MPRPPLPLAQLHQGGHRRAALCTRHYPAVSIGRNTDRYCERTPEQLPPSARPLRTAAALLARHLRSQPGRAGAGDGCVRASRQFPRDRPLAAGAQHGARAGGRVPPRAAGSQHTAGRRRFRARSAGQRHAGSRDALAAQIAGAEHARPGSVGRDGAGQVRQPASRQPRLAGDAARAARARRCCAACCARRPRSASSTSG